MKIRPLSIEGAFEVTPTLHGDARGTSLEWFRWDKLADAVGHPLNLVQGNVSVSAKGVIRGIHFVTVPVGQAKYVSCLRGAVLDAVVDVRVGSPTFGRYELVQLDDVERKAVYLAEGLGHGICALTDDATLTYLCSSTYEPSEERGVHPLDPELGIAWPVKTPADSPVLSPRDAAAPTLLEARERGDLPDYQACRDYLRTLRSDLGVTGS
ncbi:MAG TPA: dTDP-4-dehydrorhamnose 3,5-epimerase family protein [Candidatus Limnocylindrales bacterium]|nr:dTDP-4-dehydrorhamnose 3,5-epimerase family protein [Candidatus Limnocylindrales bacterium]